MADVADADVTTVCPQCGGDWKLKLAQDPERLIASAKANAQIPTTAMRYAERTREKAASKGVIHQCRDCGYESRFHAPGSDEGAPDEPAPVRQPGQRRAALPAAPESGRKGIGARVVDEAIRDRTGA